MVSIAFIRTSHTNHVNRAPWFPEVRLGIWRQSCDQMVILLDNHSQTMLFNLRRFQELGDKRGAGVIRSSCIICFAHLSVLYETLGKLEAAPHTELNALCDLALERLCGLVRDMCVGEYTRLDLLLGVCAIL